MSRKAKLSVIDGTDSDIRFGDIAIIDVQADGLLEDERPPKGRRSRQRDRGRWKQAQGKRHARLRAAPISRHGRSYGGCLARR
jgi:hypothetical protein